MTLLRKITGVAFILFPFAIFALDYYKVHYFYSFALAACAILLHVDFSKKRQLLWQFGVLCGFAVPMFFISKENLPRLYPFFFSGSVLIAMILSRSHEENFLEIYSKRFATVTEERKQFLSKALNLWIFGIGLNTAVLFVLLFAFSTKTWALYVGVFGYLYIALLFVLTFLYRFISSKKKPA